MSRIGWILAAGLLIASFPMLADGLMVAWPDIEQGACTLIMGPDGTGAIIDAGTLHARTPDENVVSWLRDFSEAHPDFRLRYIFATHYHQDHICWIDDIIAAGLLAPDGVVYDRGGSYSSATFATYKSAVSPYRQTINLGQVIDLGGGAILKCLVAAGRVYEDGSISTSDENNLSLGFLLSYDDFQLWVGGDLEAEVEELAKDVVGDVDVYVVHHHGSRTSSTASFLEALKPEVAVCQTGLNPYGHPTQEVLQTLLSTVDTDGNPGNGTPLVILQNQGSYMGGLDNVFVADPDGPGSIPGTIELTTDGTTYTIRLPSLPTPLSLSTDSSVTGSSGRESAAQEMPSSTGEDSLGTYVLTLVGNRMPVYHSSKYWMLIVYPEGSGAGVVTAARSSLNEQVFERELNPGDTVTLWIAAIDPEKWPDVGQTTYVVNIPVPCPEVGWSITFEVPFTVHGDSGGPASMTFTLERIR